MIMNNRKNYLKKVNAMFAAAAAFAFLVTGCTSNSEPEAAEHTDAPVESSTEKSTEAEMTSTSANASSADAVSLEPVVNLIPENAPFTSDISDLFTDRDLRTDYEITSSINLNEITDSTLTISQEGVFALSGTFSGQVRINCDGGKVQLVLNHADITCPNGSAIYVENAKKVFITLAENSENTISDGTGYANASVSGAAIFSSESLTINGTGHLTVNGNENEGIVSKDDLTITGGNLTVNAVGNGIRGKDHVAVYDGNIQITSGSDGLKSSNATDEGKGFIYIQNGNFVIDAAEDGMQAESELIIADGSFQITSGGGIDNAEEKHDDMMGGFRMQNTTSSHTAEDSVSVKGLKAGSVLYLSGGMFSMNTADDALHSNGNLYIAGGNLQLSAGDKGMHADAELHISDGLVNILQSYEGIEAADILVSGGTVRLNSSDDGFNASDGSDQGARGDAVNCSLTISGGDVYVNANGDGLDSNGTLSITGGTVLVDGPENNGNGALDANNGIICSGGLLIAAGSSGMAEYPDEAAQNVIVITLDSYQNPDTLVTLCDDQNTEILSYAPSKKFDSVIISSDALESGKSYTLCLDGTESGSVTLEDSVSFIGEPRAMGMPGGGGMMPGGHGGQMPDNMQIPTDENGDFDRSQFKGGRRGMKDENFTPDDRRMQNG